MPGATHGTRWKLSAKGKKKYYATLCFDGRNTERFAGETEEDANALGIRLCYEYNQNRAGVIKASDKAPQEALEAFCNRPVDDKTNELNQTNLEPFLERYRIKRISDISKDVIVKWKYDLEKHVKQDRGGKEIGHYSDSYISIKLRALRAFLHFCVEKGWLVQSPFPKKIIPRYFSKGHFFTEHERQLLLSPVETRDQSVREADADLIRAITISFYQGWRESQVQGMDWKHYRAQDNKYFLRGIKGAQDKWVTLHPKTVAAMGEPRAGGRVFERWNSPDVLGQAFRRKRKLVGLTVGRPHDMKHTSVSLLEENGYTLTEISEINNTSRAALVHYSHANQERLKKRFKEFTL